jgi:uncharacterized RDD family membrane protein YckC
MMSHDAAATPGAHAKRARFWVRVVAFGIDVLLVNLLISVVGVALMGLTDGKIRIAKTVVDVVDCASRQSLPPGLPVPDGFEVADVSRCTRAVLGVAHDWTLVVRERMRAGADEEARRQVKIPLDAKGQPVHAFYLDGLIPLVLAVYLLLLEWQFGTTPGKHFFFIMVRSLGGRPMDFAQAGKRLLLRLVVLLQESNVETPPGSSTASHRMTFEITTHGIPDIGIWSTVFSVLAFVYFINFIITTSHRALPLHDRWARTEAVRLTGD